MRRDDLIRAVLGDEKFVARFWAKVDRRGADECWEWRGWRKRGGYGAFFFPVRLARRRYGSAHRLSWALAHGDAPGDICVLHRCDNPPCVNPAHLFLGTLADNNRDKEAKGRGARGERLSPHSDATVREIRRLAAMMPGRAVAEKLGVPSSTVQAIIAGQYRRDA